MSSSRETMFYCSATLKPYVTVHGYTVVIAASTPAMETITRTLQCVRIHAVEKSFLKVHSAENNLYWWFITNVPVVGQKQSVFLKKKKSAQFEVTRSLTPSSDHVTAMFLRCSGL